jgi:hypothetical protein
MPSRRADYTSHEDPARKCRICSLVTPILAKEPLLCVIETTASGFGDSFPLFVPTQ